MSNKFNNKETRIFGPPGTGKTTYLARQIELAAEKYGPENVIVASFTKAAAVELNMRRLSIPRDNMGTLHALCYRAMGSPPIAEKHAAEFNEVYPQFAISEDTGNVFDEMAADASYNTDGDEFLRQYNLQRAKCLPRDSMHPLVVKFAHDWERWKTKNDYVDFTDMIYYTWQNKLPPPGEPRVGFFDESQDFSALELALVRQWANYLEYILIAGDDDQCIYPHRGASPDAFLNPPVSVEQKRVLRQSYRLPRRIHAYAEKWIKQVKFRETKEYKPRDEEGQVEAGYGLDLRQTEHIIETADEYANAGKTIMILASCKYMLIPLIAALRRHGIPFHNPYRPNKGDWNPLGNFFGSRKGTISTRERLLAFLNKPDNGTNFWSFDKLDMWLDMMKSTAVFKKDMKKEYEQARDRFGNFQYEGDPEFYKKIFTEIALQRATERDLPWFKESLLAARKKAIEYPLSVYRKRGIGALSERPRITIGTIHSTKGGEHDIVMLFPDLSVAGFNEYRSQNRDPVIRTFYVGMTRAKETLLLCKPMSNLAVRYI